MSSKFSYTSRLGFHHPCCRLFYLVFLLNDFEQNRRIALYLKKKSTRTLKRILYHTYTNLFIYTNFFIIIQNTTPLDMRWNTKEARKTPNSEVVERKYRRNRALLYARSLSNRASGVEALRSVRMKELYAYVGRSVDDIVGGVA